MQNSNAILKPNIVVNYFFLQQKHHHIKSLIKFELNIINR